MLVEWLKLSLMTSGSIFGVYIVFGLIMNQLEIWNTQFIFQSVGYIGIVITGFVGTVVHELSHFIMCLLFGHKVTSVAWFRPVAAQNDGVLGYVQHSYDPSSLYQRVGNFFIGIAPMILGSLFIMILFYLFLPSSAKEYTGQLRYNVRQITNSFTVMDLLKMMGRQTSSLLRSLFTVNNLKKPLFWLFLFLMYSISSHMSISYADLKGALSGFAILFVMISILCLVMVLFRVPIEKYSRPFIYYNAFMIGIFTVGVTFSLLTLGLSFLISRIG